MDTGRWGWLSRRMRALARLTRRFLDDPTGTIEAAITEVDDARFAASARAVAAGMDPIVLLALLKRILRHPEAAAGLPDLLAWKGQQVAMWEVKSPGDQLRDGQRDWLAWGRAHGLQVGVWEITAKAVAQTSFLAKPTPVPAEREASRTTRGTTAVTRWRTAPQRLPVAYGSAVPDTNHLWSRSPTCAAEWCSAAEIPMPPGHPRPILNWLAWRPPALLSERYEGRRVVERRWHLLPAGWWIPLAICEEAHPESGIRTFASLMTRRAGWWMPARFSQEPVLLPDAIDPGNITSEQVATWAVYPEEPVVDPEARVAALPLGDELHQQLACLGSSEHAVVPPTLDGPPLLAIPAEAGVLWVAPSIARTPLDVLLRPLVAR